MQTVNMHEAKTQLSRLVDQAAAGQEIVIARAGKPIARLVALASSDHAQSGMAQTRILGILSGQLAIPETFDHPLPDDLLDLFEGR